MTFLSVLSCQQPIRGKWGDFRYESLKILKKTNYSTHVHIEGPLASWLVLTSFAEKRPRRAGCCLFSPQPSPRAVAEVTAVIMTFKITHTHTNTNRIWRWMKWMTQIQAGIQVLFPSLSKVGCRRNSISLLLYRLGQVFILCLASKSKNKTFSLEGLLQWSEKSQLLLLYFILIAFTSFKASPLLFFMPQRTIDTWLSVCIHSFDLLAFLFINCEE